MTKKINPWDTDAGMMLSGMLINIVSDDHLKHVLGYMIKVIRNAEEVDLNEVEEVFNKAYRYNSDKDRVECATANKTDFGYMITLVREHVRDITTQDGVLAYVYNVSEPVLSELGYVFFAKSNGAIRRIA